MRWNFWKPKNWCWCGHERKEHSPSGICFHWAETFFVVVQCKCYTYEEKRKEVRK